MLLIVVHKIYISILRVTVFGVYFSYLLFISKCLKKYNFFLNHSNLGICIYDVQNGWLL